MSDDTENRLHYGSETFDLAEDPHDVGHRLVEKLRDGGGMVDVMTDKGGITLLVSAGVPIWFDRRRKVKPAAPSRIR